MFAENNLPNLQIVSNDIFHCDNKIIQLATKYIYFLCTNLFEIRQQNRFCCDIK